MNGHRSRIIVVALAFGALAAPASAGPFDNVLKKMEDSVGRHTEDLGERAVDRAFDESEGAVACAAGDQECLRKRQQNAPPPPTLAAKKPDVARCVATDTACLKDAKARGVHVEIVDESELDTIRCSMSDADCMKRAKQLGKKVELTD